MLDLKRIENVKLSRRPIGQMLLGDLLLWPDYHFPRATEITLEGTENLPRDRPAFLAMNHTDRYNYWPLQYQLYRRRLGFTATWVKGKYYENRWMARFLDLMNNIPLPSRGYVITTEFRKHAGRVPEPHEYRLLRALIDAGRDEAMTLSADASPALRDFVGPSVEDFLARFDATFARMIDAVVRLNRRAVEELELYVLVFPEGTRRKRLGRGHTGLAQMTQHLGASIVPIGCNGSDRLYPGNSPLSKGGHVVYRIGPALDVEHPDLAPHRVPASVRPLTREAERYAAQYQAITDVVMGRIADLLDPEYLPTAGTDELADADSRGEGEEDVARFV